jgi:hypothetical protein
MSLPDDEFVILTMAWEEYVRPDLLKEKGSKVTRGHVTCYMKYSEIPCIDRLELDFLLHVFLRMHSLVHLLPAFLCL